MTPEEVATDYRAEKISDEHAATSLIGAIACGAAGVVGIEYLSDGHVEQGALFLSGALVLGAIAFRSVFQAMRYSRRQGELDPNHRY